MRLEIISRDYDPDPASEPFSVCMTVLDEAASIADFLGSPLAQNLQPDEIVIVDAGSRDDTVKRIKSCEDRRISLLEVPGASPAAARNMACGMARHELQVTVDAGCILDRRLFANLLGPMREADPPEVAAGIFRPRMPTGWALYFIPDWRDVAYLEAKFLPSCRASAVRRSFVRKVGGFDEGFIYKAGEDTLFMMKARAISRRWVLNRKAFVLWDATTTFEETVRLAYHYGVGNGQVGCAYHKAHYLGSRDPVVAAAFEGYKFGCGLRTARETRQADGVFEGRQ